MHTSIFRHSLDRTKLGKGRRRGRRKRRTNFRRIRSGRSGGQRLRRGGRRTGRRYRQEGSRETGRHCSSRPASDGYRRHRALHAAGGEGIKRTCHTRAHVFREIRFDYEIFIFSRWRPIYLESLPLRFRYHRNE